MEILSLLKINLELVFWGTVESLLQLAWKQVNKQWLSTESPDFQSQLWVETMNFVIILVLGMFITFCEGCEGFQEQLI